MERRHVRAVDAAVIDGIVVFSTRDGLQFIYDNVDEAARDMPERPDVCLIPGHSHGMPIGVRRTLPIGLRVVVGAGHRHRKPVCYSARLKINDYSSTLPRSVAPYSSWSLPARTV